MEIWTALHNGDDFSVCSGSSEHMSSNDGRDMKTMMLEGREGGREGERERGRM